MLHPRSRWIALATAACLAATACSDQPADDAGPTVAAAFYAVEYAAELVAGDAAQVMGLTAPGIDAHDAELTPAQMAGLSKADVVIYLRGFQPSIDKAIDEAKPKRVIELGELLGLEGLGIEGHGHDHDHDHGHDHGGIDPHFWTDPTLLEKTLTPLAEGLAEADPDHAQQYQDNAETGSKRLTQLDWDLASGLGNCARREFMTQHAAFSYFAHRYDLTQLNVAGISPDEEPSPARIADIQEEARKHEITTVFVEPGDGGAIARSIAQDLGLQTDTLDPIEGVSAEEKDYEEAMRANLEALRKANDC